MPLKNLHIIPTLKRRTIITALLGGLIAVAIPMLGASAAHALSGSDFKADNIIDNSVFYNNTTMSASTIQNFLNAKVPTCDTSGSTSKSYYYNSTTGRLNNSADTWVTTTRAVYGQRYNSYYGVSYAAAPYTCVKDYSQSVPSQAANSYCAALGAGTRSAAQIIYDVAQSCGVNPMTLIVTLQKEQGLVTDDWPWGYEYQSATGYGCPDTGSCDSTYYGFFNQVYQAAQAFKRYQAHVTDYNYQPGRNNTILWNPDTSCGSSTVYIQNQATANLYIYTPYRPNQAALDNLYGTGDNCSAYGNRNFWRYFMDWFGTTYGTFSNFSDPRYLQANTNLQKINVTTGNADGDPLTTGQQVKFASKIFYDGNWCFRTQHDTDLNIGYCVLNTDLNELTISPTAISGNTLFEAKQNLQKVDMRRGIPAGDHITQTQQVGFSTQATIAGTLYYITAHDSSMGLEYGVPASELTASPTYTSIAPYWQQLKASTQKIDPTTQQKFGSALPSGMIRPFVSKALVNGVWYYRTGFDTSNYFNQAIPETALQNVAYQSFDLPRWMTVPKDTTQVIPFDNSPTGSTVTAGTQLKFVAKIFLNNTWYFRTDTDTSAQNFVGFPASKVSDLQFVPMTRTNMTLKQDTQKYVPAQEQPTGDTFPTGMTRAYTSKMLVNGQWYYRTETDTGLNNNLGIPASAFQ